jgi:4-hydroxybenzoate polyprenyltransferase
MTNQLDVCSYIGQLLGDLLLVLQLFLVFYNILIASSLLFLFFMGAWTSRSAGCIINDYLDKDFDKKV